MSIEMTDVYLTPMQQKVMNVLGDEQRHRIVDILRAVYDEHDSTDTLKEMVRTLRRAIRPKGMDVAYVEIAGEGFYQLVRITASPYSGYA